MNNPVDTLLAGDKEIEYGGQSLNLQDPMPPNIYQILVAVFRPRLNLWNVR